MSDILCLFEFQERSMMKLNPEDKISKFQTLQEENLQASGRPGLV